MSQNLILEVVSPEKVVLKKNVAMVVVPGGEGAFGVLSGHAAMVASLQSGVVNVYENDTATISERVFVSGGFAEVTGERCMVLADEAVPVSELDRDVLDAEIVALQAKLQEASVATRAELEESLALVQAKRAAI